MIKYTVTYKNAIQLKKKKKENKQKTFMTINSVCRGCSWSL